MTFETKLMMDNKKDLTFIFDGIQSAAISACSNNQVRSLVDSYLSSVMSMTAQSCLVGGKEWKSVSESVVDIEEFEPIDSMLVAELQQVQNELDQLLTQSASLKAQFPARQRQLLLDDFESFKKELSAAVTTCDSVPQSVSSSNNNDRRIEKEDVEKFGESLDVLADLVTSLPPLVSKTGRYVEFVKDELAGDKYKQHLERLQDALDVDVEDFDALFNAKLDDCFNKAVNTRLI